jgi:hypothetical protein
MPRSEMEGNESTFPPGRHQVAETKDPAPCSAPAWRSRDAVIENSFGLHRL